VYVGIEALVDEKYDGGIDRGAEIMFVVGCGAGSDPVAVDDGGGGGGLVNRCNGSCGNCDSCCCCCCCCCCC
jgi:hypothetical protein